MATVVLKNVEKIYEGGIKVVHDFNLSIADREFIVMVGPSGCGKSTTLRMIAGLEEISRGDLFIDGRRMNDVPPKDRDIAMVFQNYALYPHMTVFENMAFGLQLRRVPKEEIKRRVIEVAKTIGLLEYLDRKPKALSGGQRQRVALGRAIVRNPKVFLFDEPLSNLDAKLRAQTRTEISKLHRMLGATMIYVTHDQVEAMTMADRIVVMNKGVIQQVDTPLNLYNNPANKFVAGFIGSPAMNFIQGSLYQNGALCFRDKTGMLDVRLPQNIADKLKAYIGADITMGIRPEDIHDVNEVEKVAVAARAKLHLEIVEPMGNEIFVYLQLPTVQETKHLVARLDARTPHEFSDEFECVIDVTRVHFFDNTTEKALV
ncbi:MAG: sn-glycerol-3-phosphate ABC transporter ATP-binding protein UgpC [Candidatus Thermochlorobacter aerophilum]|jgi:multiple sugar transport system ATP-binding protein|uniref:sn-glycerol-3-phosphate ABC transporter ATP-binding protein UgpC n=1 Tax=Candidatus Thermochlorobacter aerophilus TaxID=1868324 RepID=A0A395LWL6_9BACT|nr:MAG: sn-glycerol-3-phosphate ABC transporter ATP-binding protein UgpC [Candidatus Thermochlorobacter aerophilum]